MKLSHRLVSRIKHSLERHPLESTVCFVGGDLITMYGMYTVIQQMPQFHFSTQFVVAFSCARLVRRVRLPLDIVTASALSSAFPLLKEIKPTAVLDDFSNRVAVPYAQDNPNKASSNALDKVSAKLRGLVDKHGVAYLISARLNGVLTVWTLYQLSMYGFDASQVLQSWGMGSIDNAGALLGPWAAAVVASSSLFPLTSVLTVGYISPLVATLFTSNNKSNSHKK